jgi:hypothetical protein
MMQKLYKGKDICFCDSFYVPNFLKTGWSLSQEAQEAEAQEAEAQEAEAQEAEAQEAEAQEAEAQKPQKKKVGRPSKQQ